MWHQLTCTDKHEDNVLQKSIQKYFWLTPGEFYLRQESIGWLGFEEGEKALLVKKVF